MAWKVRSDFSPGMIDRQIERAMDDAADAWVDKSKATVHVQPPPDGGQLRRSIRKESDGRFVRRVVADATNSTGGGYAAYEDGGTRFRPAHPFWDVGGRAAADSLKRARLDR